MSMFTNNDVSLSSDTVKSLEIAKICPDAIYQSQLSSALREKDHPPFRFKKTFDMFRPNSPENFTNFKKSLPKKLIIGQLKPALPFFIFPKHLLDA